MGLHFFDLEHMGKESLEMQHLILLKVIQHIITVQNIDTSYYKENHIIQWFKGFWI